MKETIIEFETAVLAKEKGFYWFQPQSKSGYYALRTGSYFYFGRQGKLNNDTCCSAPTQSLLQKWLREKHAISINPIPNYKTKWNQYHIGIVFKNSKGEVDSIILKEMTKQNYEVNKLFDSYEQALEAGLQEALKLIKTEKDE